MQTKAAAARGSTSMSGPSASDHHLWVKSSSCCEKSAVGRQVSSSGVVAQEVSTLVPVGPLQRCGGPETPLKDVIFQQPTSQALVPLETALFANLFSRWRFSKRCTDLKRHTRDPNSTVVMTGMSPCSTGHCANGTPTGLGQETTATVIPY